MIHTDQTADWAAWLAHPQRWLAVDVGDTTLGVALSDVRHTIASPLTTLMRRAMAPDSQALADVVLKNDGGLCVVGWPLSLDGTAGPQCTKVMAFLKHFQRKSSVPVVLWDERWTTRVVERTLIEADLSRRRRGDVIDKLAACYLLQGVLDAMRSRFPQKHD